MAMKRVASTSICLVCLAALGCSEDTGKVDKNTNITGPTSFPYTPNGCSYEVNVPAALEEAAGHLDEVGTDPAPKHVHVSWAGPVESTFAVVWTAGLDTKLSQVLYGTDEAAVQAADGPTDGVSLQVGHSMLYGSTLFADQKQRAHEAHVCGLQPETTYYYKVGGAGNWSAVYDVTTGVAPGTAKKFRIALTGDSRNETAVWAEVQEKVSAEAPDLQIFSGDAVNIGVDTNQWAAFFEATTGTFAAQDVLASVPFMGVNGNHDNLSVQ
jgi:hypothetical protein